MAKKTSKTYPTELVLAAACAAQRINGRYVSSADQLGPIEVTTNKSLMLLLLNNSLEITEQDRAKAALVRTHFRAFMMKILADKWISDFDRTCMTIADGEEVSEFMLGQAAYMPASYEKARQDDAIKDRIYECRREYLDRVGAKVATEIEVLTVKFSQKYGCYFYTAITKDNFSVSFAAGDKRCEAGQTYKITAKVKGHRDQHQTQLNFVKIA